MGNIGNAVGCAYNYKFKHKEVGDYNRIVKETINTYLNVYEHSVVPEAIYCFESATKLFKEMIKLYNENV